LRRIVGITDDGFLDGHRLHVAQGQGQVLVLDVCNGDDILGHGPSNKLGELIGVLPCHLENSNPKNMVG